MVTIPGGMFIPYIWLYQSIVSQKAGLQHNDTASVTKGKDTDTALLSIAVLSSWGQVTQGSTGKPMLYDQK